MAELTEVVMPKESLALHALKQGPLFVILLILMWLMYTNSKEMKPVLESNTKVIGANNVIVDKATIATEKNSIALEKNGEVVQKAVDRLERRGR